MSNMKKQLLENINPYLFYHLHNDLISFSVSSECFEDWNEVEKNGGVAMAGFNELLVVVDKEWLFTYMKVNGIKNPRKYLQNEYTSDDSYEWFVEANKAGYVVGVMFN